MKKSRIATFVLALALCLSIGLVGCGGSKDSTSDGKGTFDAIGYQGTLDDGSEMVYIVLGEDNAMVSLIDDEHQGDDAETYSGKAVTDDDGKTTITDDESGESITLTITENADGTASIDVEGRGKGEMMAYEGNIFKMISSMAEDDE